jgi:hypothetical protein
MSTPLTDLRSRLGRTLWIPLCFLAVIFAIFVVLSPAFHDKYFGVAKYESAAVGNLRNIYKVENVYATEHPDKGFACQLKQLQLPEDKAEIHGRMNLLTGEWFGYKFEIVGCTQEKSGIVSHYQVTAVPVKPGATGVRAFCSDQSGNVFYDYTGSGSECLAVRELLP